MGGLATFKWKPGSLPVVRVLRSTEWFPETPNDFISGTFLAQRVHENGQPGFMDQSIRPEEEYFYALFAQKRDGAWCRPLHVHLFAAASSQARRSVEVHGQRERRSAGSELALWLHMMLPTAVVIGIIGLSVTGGTMQRVMAAMMLLAAAAWRVALPETELWTVVKVGAVPAALLAVLILSGALMWIASTVIPVAGTLGSSTGGLLLWTVASLAAAVGAWGLGRFAYPGRSDRPELLRTAAILGLPPLAALLWPVYAVMAMAVVAAIIAVVEQGMKQPAS